MKPCLKTLLVNLAQGAVLAKLVGHGSAHGFKVIALLLRLLLVLAHRMPCYGCATDFLRMAIS